MVAVWGAVGCTITASRGRPGQDWDWADINEANARHKKKNEAARWWPGDGGGNGRGELKQSGRVPEEDILRKKMEDDRAV